MAFLVHAHPCPFFGHPSPPAPCPLRQVWGSLDALIGGLRVAFEENSGKTESNPFGARDFTFAIRTLFWDSYLVPSRRTSLRDFMVVGLHLETHSMFFVAGHHPKTLMRPTVVHVWEAVADSASHYRVIFEAEIFEISIADQPGMFVSTVNLLVLRWMTMWTTEKRSSSQSPLLPNDTQIVLVSARTGHRLILAAFTEPVIADAPSPL
ncbi:hypothetical protein RJ640_009345 [Escallonia rubra]|uniref:ALOG domain-containing protein n=1 Tax=Escallonia rubra TaxID=112253 RepID=A0AA88UMK3_9ASTE|nr:hypothetical protein RJ640_009345 [Escallonia rubra]